jgi:hypothetical protein
MYVLIKQKITCNKNDRPSKWVVTVETIMWGNIKETDAQKRKQLQMKMEREREKGHKPRKFLIACPRGGRVPALPGPNQEKECQRKENV